MQLFSSRTWLASLTMAAGLCCSTVALAQPANNACTAVAAGGFDIPAAGGTVTGTTALATADGDCDCDNGTAGRDVYYRFTPATTTVWRLSLCAGTTIDTVMSVHTACPADVSTQIACDDDGCGTIGGPSRIQTTLTAGTTYLIRVGMWSSTAAGGAFSLVVAPVAALTNDNCATVSASGPTIPAAGGTVTGTTEDATVDGDCSCDDGDSGIDVYYKFTPGASGNWQFALCTATTIDSTLSIHSGCPADQTTEIACDDDGCGAAGTGVPSRVSASLIAGTTYIIRVGMWDSFNTAGGPFTLTATNLDQNGACCAPNGSCTVGQLGACVSPSVPQSAGSTCSVNPCPQPPANDECAGALALTMGTPRNGTISLATGTAITGGCTGSTNDVWYTFTPVATSNYQVTTTPASGTDAATAITVGTVCPQGSTADYIACSAQPGAGAANNVVFLGAAGTTYYIRLGGFAGDTGNFAVVVNSIIQGACCSAATGACTISNTGSAGCASGSTYSGDNTTCTPSPCTSQACCNAASGACTVVGTVACPSGTTGQGTGSSCTVNPCPQPPPPANDDCAAAQALTLNVAFAGNNTQATGDGTEGPGGACYTTAPTNFNKAVWFRFTAPTSDVFGITACGTNFDTVLSVFDGTCTAFGAELGCDDDACDGVTPPGSGLASVIAPVAMTAGQTYLIRLSSWGTGNGPYTITVTGTAPAGGVCCRGATCNTSITTAAACTSSLVSGQTAGAAFVSTSTTCNTTGNTTTPCCYANYNKTGGISVQDIFDFLNDWFAGSAYANTGGTGAAGALSVQNIFDFLNAWFAGGCS